MICSFARTFYLPLNDIVSAHLKLYEDIRKVTTFIQVLHVLFHSEIQVHVCEYHLESSFEVKVSTAPAHMLINCLTNVYG